MKELKTLRIIYFAVFVEALVFFAVAFLLNKDTELVWMNDENPNLFLVGLIAVVASAMGAFIVFRFLLNSVRSKVSKEERVKSYFSAAIVRIALLDVAMTICIVFFILGKAWIFALMLVLIILVYLIIFPNQNAIERDTELSIGDFSEDEFND